MCVSNSCLLFAIVKKISNLNQNLRIYLAAWIVLEMTCANYPTPKALVKGKDSPTVGHMPRMVSKHLASKQRANAAHKFEYCLLCINFCCSQDMSMGMAVLRHSSQISLFFDKE